MVIPCFECILHCVRRLYDWISEGGKVSEKMVITSEPLESHSPRPTGGIYVKAGDESEESVLSAPSCFSTVCSEWTSEELEYIQTRIARIASLSASIAIVKEMKCQSELVRPSGPYTRRY